MPGSGHTRKAPEASLDCEVARYVWEAFTSKYLKKQRKDGSWDFLSCVVGTFKAKIARRKDEEEEVEGKDF